MIVWGFMDVHKLHPKFDLIHERFGDIQKEFRDNLEHIQFGHWYDDFAHSKSGGVYNPVAAPLYGEMDQEQEQLCMLEQFDDSYEHNGLRTWKNVNWVPTLTKTLQEIGITRRASIASMKPHAKIPLHRDGDPNPPDGILLRGIIGLDGREQREARGDDALDRDVEHAREGIVEAIVVAVVWRLRWRRKARRHVQRGAVRGRGAAIGVARRARGGGVLIVG